jgi:hypothetical protein
MVRGAGAVCDAIRGSVSVDFSAPDRETQESAVFADYTNATARAVGGRHTCAHRHTTTGTVY